MSYSEKTVGEKDGFIQLSVADFTFLRQGRTALLTHPKIRPFVQESEAAACRLLILAVVTSLDRVLEQWKGDEFLEMYHSSKTSNGDRFRILKVCFEQTGVRVDAETIEDYLAIKYLRNTLTHVR